MTKQKKRVPENTLETDGPFVRIAGLLRKMCAFALEAAERGNLATRL